VAAEVEAARQAAQVSKPAWQTVYSGMLMV
jgi:hypothetical protein